MQSRAFSADHVQPWSVCLALAITAIGCSSPLHAQDAVQSIDSQTLPSGLTDVAADPGMIVDVEQETLTRGLLTLESLESFALASNPSIARAAAIVGAARGRALQVGLRPNPEIGLDFQQLGSSGLAEQYGISISQEIVRREKLGLNRSIALHEVHRLEQELAAQRQRVLTDVRIAYIRVLRAERQIELTQQFVDIGEQGVAVAMELLNAQEVGRGDVLQAELEVESASVLRQNAENRRTAAWRQLSSVTGRTLLQDGQARTEHSSLLPQPLEGNIADTGDEILFATVLAQLRSQSPEVAAALATIQRSRCNLQRQQIETRPNLTVQGLINWRDNGIGGDPDGGLMVSVPLPLWNKNQGGIREARHQLVAAERDLEQVELRLMNRLAPVYERYRNAKEQVDRYRERILPKAAETLELTRQTYELGEINFVNLLTVQRTYADKQLAYLDSLEALRLADVEIRGLLLSGSLDN